MKKKIIFAFFYILLFFVLVELTLKLFFILPMSRSKMENILARASNINLGQLPYIDWDRDLNYKWKNGTHLEKIFTTNGFYGRKFEATINADGFRSPPEDTLEALKNEPNKKIICLGESWTMGMGVDVDKSYPAQLQKILDTQASDQKYKVFNLGVLSYTSFQGLEILGRISSHIKPGDIVVIGYQANDPRQNGFFTNSVTNKKSVFLNEKKFNNTVFHMERGLTTPKIVQAILGTEKFKISRQGNNFNSFWDIAPRVPFNEYVSNYLKMIEITRSKGGNVILLYHGMFKEQDYTAKGVYQTAQMAKVPVANVRDPMLKMVADDVNALESEFPDLRKSTSNNSENSYTGKINNVKVIFRISSGKQEELFYPASPKNIEKMELCTLSNKNGSLETETFPLNDKGVDGDEFEGDGVWSKEITLPLTLDLLKMAPVYMNQEFKNKYELHTFFYFKATTRENDKEKVYSEYILGDKTKPTPLWVNMWRGIPVGQIENIAEDRLQYSDLPEKSVSYFSKQTTPIYIFGQQFQRSEFVHPVEGGYQMYAEEIFKAIKDNSY